MADLIKQIEVLLSEPVSECAERERVTFKLLCEEGDGSVVLFGAGKLGRLCAQSLRRSGVPLRAFCDSDPSMHGALEGVEVLGPDEAARRFGDVALFVVSIWTGTARENMVERIAILKRLGCKRVTTYAPLFWALGREYLPIHSFDLPTSLLADGAKIRELAELLEDEESLRALLSALRQRLKGDFEVDQPVVDQYFPNTVVCLTDKESVVDGGAFDGDTLMEFIRRTKGHFHKYRCFEPDPNNARKLRQRVAKLPRQLRDKVALYQFALNSAEGRLGFESSGQASHMLADAAVSVQGVTLDQILGDEPVTFLKLDIEGAEFDALLGARELLSRQCPLAAVCVYHGPTDLWTIPLQLKSWMPHSRIFLRRHGFDGWECVCYAVPPRKSWE